MRQTHERYFLVMSVILLLTVFVGFARTLYLRPFFDGPEFPAYLLLAHGGVLSLWFLWFLIQAMLVASGRINVHRRMGVIGAGLAVAVVTVGVVTLLGAVPRRVSLGASIEENLWPLAALLHDRRSLGHVHRVTAWGAPGYFLFWLICLFVVPSTVIGGATVRWLAQ